MAVTFERIVYFGDSLSDGGTIFDVTSQLLLVPFPLASAGYAGVFADGPVHTQLAPGLLGVASANYAAGGARAIGVQPIGDLLTRNGADALIAPTADPALLDFDINLGGQVTRFLADEAANPSQQNTAASFLIGLNDISGFVPSSPDPAVATAEATALLQGIIGATVTAAQQAVFGGGADSVILYTFPGVSFFPFSAFVDPALLPFGDLLVAGHAQAIAAAAAGLGAAGIATEVVNLGEITAEIQADMGTFGFLSMGPVWFGAATNPDITVGPGGVELTFPANPAVAGLDADQIAFFDLLHPTTALHGIVAAFSTAVLEEGSQVLGLRNDRLTAGAADDFVLARAGNDVVDLGAGADTAFGGLGNDRVNGGAGSDLISGGSGRDVLFGGDDADLIADGAGDDGAYGGLGDDVLVIGRGADRAYGGLGDDTFLWTDPSLNGGAGDGADIVHGGLGSDTLYLAVSEALRAAVEADIAGRGALAQATGFWDLASIGVTAIRVEQVVLVDSRAALTDIALTGDGALRLAEADLWGLV